MKEKIIKEKILKEIIKKRAKNTYKSKFGRALLICGSKSFGGASIMATKAAVYSGAGLTTLASDFVNRTTMLSTIPEAMFCDYSNQNQLLGLIKSADTILIGSGLEKNQFSTDILKTLFNIATEKQKIIIDGTALSIIGEGQVTLPDKPITVLTPHQGEWVRLSGLKIPEQNSDNNFSLLKKLNANYLVLKSSNTEIYDLTNTKNYYKLTIGGPFQSIGGMGDTLAGIITGFLAQFKNKNLLKIIEAAVYIHSDIARQLSKKNYISLPTKISEHLPQAMREKGDF